MATYFIQNTNSVEDIEQMNNVIDKVNKVNTEATSNIGQLTDLNNKATELSNNINQALPLNSELVKNTEEAKTANTNLAATNQEAVSKNTELQASLEKTKEFIDGLDGSQNIPGIRMELTELQNGLKSNQALEYSGDFITANNTLEGRSEGMIIKGRTLVNLVSNNPAKNAGNVQIEKLLKSEMFKVGTTYTVNIPNRNNKQIIIVVKTKDGVTKNINLSSTTNTFTVEEDYPIVFRLTLHTTNGWDVNNDLTNADKSVIVEGNNIIIDNYFEGLKSFGEQEGNKISILSHGKNFFNINDFSEKINEKGELEFKADGNSRINSYVVIFTENNALSQRIAVIGGTGEKLFTTINQEEYYIHIGLNGDKKDDKLWRKIVLPKNTTCCISISSTAENNNTIKFKYVQIEVGTSKTQYEPYKFDKKDILIKEPLRNIGNIQDILYEDNGQVKINRYVKEYTFTGDEILRKSNTYGDVIRFDYKLTNLKFASDIICNNFAKGTIGKENLECINVHSNDNLVQIQIKANKLETQDVEGFRKWLKANPTTIIYQLATPTTEIVENCVDIDLDTYQEKTYFNILNSLPGTLDFKVPTNIASIVQNTAREVNNIWDVINNLLVPSLIDINKNVAMSTIKNNLK